MASSSSLVVFALLSCVFLVACHSHASAFRPPLGWPTTEEEMAAVLRDVNDHQNDADAIFQLATQGSFKGVTYDRLADFTDNIGSRLCGSASLAEGVQRAQRLLTAEGFDNVHLEETSEPVWIRGNEYAELRAPRTRPYKLAMLGLGNSIATPRDGIEADVIVVRNFTELQQKGALGLVKGKIVVYNQYCNWAASPTGCYGQSNSYRTQGAVNAAAQGTPPLTSTAIARATSTARPSR